MEILAYLAELIQQRKQVGVAGLGTIYKSKVPGRYDAKAHAFLPPSYSLEFSTELLESEALAEYISFKRNISVESANYYIEQFSNQVVQELSETGTTQLGTLGKLSSINGSIVFEPAEGSAEAEYFGLPRVNESELTKTDPTAPVVIEQVEDEFVEDMSAGSEDVTIEEITEKDLQREIVQEEEVEASEEPVSEKIEEIIEENRLEEENPGAEDSNLASLLPTEINRTVEDHTLEEAPEEDYRNPYLKFVLAAILVVGILALAYFMYPKMMASNQAQLESASVTDTSYASTKEIKTDAVNSQDTAVSIPVVDTISKDTLTAPVAEVVEKPTVTTYEIIIGSLANLKEAKKFIAQMKRKGIRGTIVDSLTSSKIKVSIASFTDHEAAKKERRKFVKQLNDPSIYIYTNKPKK